jgi:hypothetical protein
VADLRFTGDPWVTEQEDGFATLYLGSYSLLRIGVLPFDIPSLNRTLLQVRLARMRRNALCQRRALRYR